MYRSIPTEALAQEPKIYSMVMDKAVGGVDRAAALRYITERRREAEGENTRLNELEELYLHLLGGCGGTSR